MFEGRDATASRAALLTAGEPIPELALQTIPTVSTGRPAVGSSNSNVRTLAAAAPTLSPLD
jgi:hypothetical protein